MQAAPLPIGLVTYSNWFRDASYPRGLEASLVVCWWLLREVELASLGVSELAFTEGRRCGLAELTVRASKEDTEARGCKRKRACICPSAICPVAAARALVHGRKLEDVVLQCKGGNILDKRGTIRLLKLFAESHGWETTRITTRGWSCHVLFNTIPWLLYHRAMIHVVRWLHWIVTGRRTGLPVSRPFRFTQRNPGAIMCVALLRHCVGTTIHCRALIS